MATQSLQSAAKPGTAGLPECLLKPLDTVAAAAVALTHMFGVLSVPVVFHLGASVAAAAGLCGGGVRLGVAT
jgi:hypothetical protein